MHDRERAPVPHRRPRTTLPSASNLRATRRRPLWGKRARREQRAAGIKTPRSPSHPATDTLTPQELRIALIIADGATIQQAATQLLPSPKTIEAHLGRAYRKLGGCNRAQLANTIAGRDTIAA